MQIRTCGTSGPIVIVLHGGPGAPGHMAPVARGLADRFRVLEPFQRGSDAGPLTVACHIADLHELIVARAGFVPPALVGSSWGAMLALAYAAAHPESAGPLVLIGCGTFDPAARARLHTVLQERMDTGLQRRLEGLPREFPDPEQRLRMFARLTLPLYSCELVTTDQQIEWYDARARQETWNDMLRLQEEGVYPAAFSAIRSPILMLHGALDPHPGRMIRASLQSHLPQLEYREWEQCGHYPWLEKAVREDFFSVLRSWLLAASSSGLAPDRS